MGEEKDKSNINVLRQVMFVTVEIVGLNVGLLRLRTLRK